MHPCAILPCTLSIWPLTLENCRVSRELTTSSMQLQYSIVTQLLTRTWAVRPLFFKLCIRECIPPICQKTLHMPQIQSQLQGHKSGQMQNFAIWLAGSRIQDLCSTRLRCPLCVPDLWQSLEATLQPRNSVEPNQHVGLRSYEFYAGRVVRSPEMGGYIKGLASWSNALKSGVLGAYIQEGCFCKQFLFIDRTGL